MVCSSSPLFGVIFQLLFKKIWINIVTWQGQNGVFSTLIEVFEL